MTPEARETLEPTLGAAAGASRGDARTLAALVREGGVVVLSGAGVSTESGIPDYRDERGAWKRSPPMQYRDFVGSEARRRRYWARSLLGFKVLGGARPNRAHAVLADWQRRGLVTTIVTQNVDGLHQAAGAASVIDLHGRIDRVVCLECKRSSARSDLQRELEARNPEWAERASVIAPDGDADPGGADDSGFRVVACDCGGLLKPDVVFFGENVPRERVEQAMAALEAARSLLVVGSSLMVFSGYRFARAAARLGRPIAVVNRGHTRADELARVKLDGEAGEALSAVSASL
ncbi:MAG TPA: NAD-dependent protein deacetylase [Polyangiaceae bacterium]|nr:NAD-dependent protein deacetylase [Polyangiaceae bacterium]